MTVRRYDEMTWEEVHRLDRDRTLAILPVGATEAHGPHLPLSTDVLISEAMARAGAELLEEADLVVPVPLHRWRLLRRRYNQSALLALAVSRSSGVAAVPDLIRRVRATASQGGLSAGQRRRNVAGAFRVAPRLVDRVAGRRVVLVDDVHTTGATLVACTGALRRAGATDVDVLTLARVVRPSA